MPCMYVHTVRGYLTYRAEQQSKKIDDALVNNGSQGTQPYA